MKQRIKKVYIGDKEYDIIYTGELSNAIITYEPSIMGKLDPQSECIHVFEHPSKNSTKNTTLHEIIHGIDIFMNTGLNEDQIIGITNGIIDMAKRNKKLTKELLELGD